MNKSLQEIHVQDESKSDSDKHLATYIQVVRGGRKTGKCSLSIYTDHSQCS